MRIGAGRTQGQMLAAAGGSAPIGSLWLPWYAMHFPLSAWRGFTATPAVLFATGATTVVLSLLELIQRAGDTSRLAILAGAVATVLVAYRLAVPPAGNPAWGAYASLTAALAMIAGGLRAAAEDWIPAIAMPAIPAIDLAPTTAPRPTPPSAT